MTDFVPYLLSFLLLYKYWALFGVIFLSAIIVPFPSNSVLLATGAFASQGYFNFPLSIGVAVGANVLGDCIDYALARRYGRHITTTLRIRLPSYIERLEEFMRRHPGPTIFVTRFIGTIEEVVSVLSGFIGIPFGVFLFYDVLGNVISDGGILAIGYYLGVHWEDFTGLFSIFGWILVALVCIGVLWVAMRYRTRRRSEKK